MGNKLGRRRQVVDEKFTRPQGLYQHKDVDHKKLRKLILDSKLAPCYPGEDECATNSELEECPICFLYYPSLNRSRCCMKGICTECFLQMKTPNSTLPTQCPFCKTLNYAVEYRGVKSKEEKGIEQIEEQLVIEAKIRMRKQELQDEEDRMLKRKEMCSSSSISGPSEMEYSSTAGAESSLATAIEGTEVVTSQETCSAPATRQPIWPRQIREDDFDLDLEDIMIMEAIWLSIQENGKPQIPGYSAPAPLAQYVADDNHVPMASTGGSSSSPSGGLACAIAALAERQQMGKESSSSYSGGVSSSYDNHHSSCNRSPNRAVQENDDYPLGEMPMDGEDGEWADNGSSRPEAETGYAVSDDVGEVVEADVYPTHGETERADGFQPILGPIIPESFEEQMMLAMAVSLADSQARTNAPGEAWH